MKEIFTAKNVIKWLLIPCCIFSVNKITAQAPAADTVRVVQIVKGNSLREKKIDSLNTFQTIAGDVVLREGMTIFSCDSAAINKTTNVMEAFGNIHINQQDSIHTYSQYMKYVGKERMAYLKKNVKLTDKKGILYTEELEYDLKSSIGKYSSGGKVVNGKTTLTSDKGVYYSETKDVFFKEDVHLVDPKYDIRTDSMQYNTQTQLATFIAPTFIKSKDGGDVYTTSGNYDLKKGKAFFGSRSIIKDSSGRTYIADNIASDDSTGQAQLEGNAIVKDSAGGYTILAGQIFSDKNKKTFLATRKPVLIFKGDGNDSTFIAADTLFSGMQNRDSVGALVDIRTDTLKTTTVISGDDNNAVETRDDDRPPVDIKQRFKDKALNKPGDDKNAVAKTDTVLPKKIIPPPPVDTAIAISPIADSNMIAKADTSVQKEITPAPDTTNAADSTIKTSIAAIKKDSVKNNAADTIRYFLAFHNVRIFNDSLQAVCDSLYYSSLDSVFRLFQEPLVFSNKSQVSGDTIHLFTKNKKANRIHVFYNGMLINKVNESIYNQLTGRTLNGYFKDGQIDYMRSKGQPAESIFYPQDDDSAFTGMNRCTGEVIDIYFVKKEVNKVKFISDVNGTFFPIRQIPAEQRYLQNFEWLDKRRPKTKIELFE